MNEIIETPEYSFAVVGAGWRTLFYRRVAAALGERFHLTGVVTRSPARAAEVEAAWGVAAYPNVHALVEAHRPDFVVLSVPRDATVAWLETLTDAGLPVLCETPPAGDLDGLQRVGGLIARGARVQVAEQYQYQPLHAARLAVTDGGLIGDVSMASLAVCHDYHAFSLMRRHLRISDEPATIRATVVRSSVEAGFTTSGPRRERGTVEETRTVGFVDFGDRLGVYDFAGEQYFSYIRVPRVDLRGGSGEIADRDVRRLTGLDEPTTQELRREQTGSEGDLGGYSLRGISLGDRWVYRNPFAGARLSDDEIAVATSMEHMGRYTRGGPSFYGLADASQDHYLSLLLHQAAATGELVRTEPQPWADALLDPAAVGGSPLGLVVEDRGTSAGRL
ncbi:MAG: Gfo/Idh/MocA family oxidoreductase [Propionibacterium sp.]|nr:Gfo/Idh/MocA family oxidoreductase [Propionibacterium sp.]